MEGSGLDGLTEDHLLGTIRGAEQSANHPHAGWLRQPLDFLKGHGRLDAASE